MRWWRRLPLCWRCPAMVDFTACSNICRLVGDHQVSYPRPTLSNPFAKGLHRLLFSGDQTHKNNVLLLGHQCLTFKGRLWFACVAMVASTSITEAPTRFAPQFYPLQLVMQSFSPSPCLQFGLLLMWKDQMKELIAFFFSLQVLLCNFSYYG